MGQKQEGGVKTDKPDFRAAPIIHLNGSSPEVLETAWADVYNASVAFSNAVENAKNAVHMRDYYVYGDSANDAYNAALDLLNKMTPDREAMTQALAIVLFIQQQIRERNT